MGNCLVTKLKGSVDANLPILNELRIRFFNVGVSAAGRTFTINVRNQGATLKRVSGNGTFTVDGGSSVTEAQLSNGSHTIVGTDNDFEISLSDKYVIWSIGPLDGSLSITKGWGIDVSQLDYNRSFGSLILNGNQDFNTIFSPKYSARMYFTRLQGVCVNLDSFDYGVSYQGIPELLKLLPADSGYSKGSIVNLAKYIKLNEVVTYSPNVTGEIDDLCAAQIAAGRTTGSISFGVVGSSITDNGNVITSSYIRSKGGTSRIVATFSSGTYTKSYT